MFCPVSHEQWGCLNQPHTMYRTPGFRLEWVRADQGQGSVKVQLMTRIRVQYVTRVGAQCVTRIRTQCVTRVRTQCVTRVRTQCVTKIRAQCKIRIKGQYMTRIKTQPTNLSGLTSIHKSLASLGAFYGQDSWGAVFQLCKFSLRTETPPRCWPPSLQGN
jgi:hypothetical protein